MFIESPISIGKSDDGTYIISLHVCKNPDSDLPSPTAEKILTAKNIDDLNKKLKVILKNMKNKLNQDTFEVVFNEITKEE